jgi:hypothetical protein
MNEKLRVFGKEFCCEFFVWIEIVKFFMREKWGKRKRKRKKGYLVVVLNGY